MFGPLRVRGASKQAAEKQAKDLLAKSAWPSARITIRLNSPAASSSVWPLPARWR